MVSATNTAMQTQHQLTLVSLDIQGAYDTVWHTGLVWKLSSLNVPPNLIKWIASLLFLPQGPCSSPLSGGPSPPLHRSPTRLPPFQPFSSLSMSMTSSSSSAPSRGLQLRHLRTTSVAGGWSLLSLPLLFWALRLVRSI